MLLKECPPPSPLYLSWARITVVLVPAGSLKSADADEEDWGQYDYDTHTVTLDEGAPERVALDTLFHELDHAIAWTYAAFPNVKQDDREEHAVLMLGNGRTELLIRNPALVDWMLARLKNIWAEDGNPS